jgi:biotin operon repressor
MAKIKLKPILGKNAHWTLNKVLVRQLGLAETLVLQHIIDLTESAFKKEQIFQPINQMAEELGITEYNVKQAVTKLKEVGLIEVERRGIPYKNYYSVNSENVMEFMSGSNSPTIESNSTQYSEKTKINSIDDTNSTQHSVEINSIDSINSTQRSVENYITNTNNTPKNTLPIIKTNNTTNASGNTYNIIDKILSEIINTEDVRRSYRAAVELMNDYDYDELQEIMNWDTDVRRNWERTIKGALNTY